MEKYSIIRDEGVIESPAVNFVSTNLRSGRVPWFHMAHTVADIDNFFHHSLAGIYEIRDTWFYVHSLLPKGPTGPNYKNNIDYKILNALQSLGVIPEFETHQLTRAQVNCVHKTESIQITPPHRNFDEPGFVYVYYVNDSDGDTILFDNEGKIEAAVKPAAGRQPIR